MKGIVAERPPFLTPQPPDLPLNTPSAHADGDKRLLFG